MRRPRWGHWPERDGHGPDARPFPDPNGQNADQTRVRLGRPVGVILTVAYICLIQTIASIFYFAVGEINKATYPVHPTLACIRVSVRFRPNDLI